GIVDESEVQAAAEWQQSDDPPRSVKSGGKDEWSDESTGGPVTRSGVRTRAKEREKVRPRTPKRPQPKVGNTGKRTGKKKESGSKISQATHTQPMEHVQSSEPIDPAEPLDHGEPGSGDALGPTTAVSTSGSKEGDKTTPMKTTPGPKVVGQPAKRLYPAPKDYAITPNDSVRWENLIHEISELAECTWAECSKCELTRQQERLPILVADLLSLLAHGTGAELYAVGAMAKRNDHQGFHTASPRSYHFLNQQESFDTRAVFAKYIYDYIGPAMCVSPRCPAPVVYGDPDRQNHPILPEDTMSHARNQALTYDYLSSKLQWQGGSIEVPYKAIEKEAAKGRFSIVLRDSLPESIPYLRNPMLMGPEELGILTRHLRASDRQELPLNKRFQFSEPRPGVKIHGYQIKRALSTLRYRPESWAYRLFLEDIRELGTPERKDELPFYSEDSPPYLSFDSEEIESWVATLGSEDMCTPLFYAILAHDNAQPHHATEEHWHQRVAKMPHLKKSIPGERESLGQLRDRKGWLSRAFYEITNKDHSTEGVGPTLDWCDPAHFRHEASNTLEGGPLGAKWPVLMLGHVRRNALLVINEPAKTDAHYGTTPRRIEFVKLYQEYLEIAVEKLLSALQESTSLLESSKAERGECDPMIRAARETERRHKWFSLGCQAMDMHTATLTRDCWVGHIPRGPDVHYAQQQQSSRMDLDAPGQVAQLEVESQDTRTQSDASEGEMPPTREQLLIEHAQTPGELGVEDRGVQSEKESQEALSDEQRMETDNPPIGLVNLQISPRAARTPDRDVATPITTDSPASGSHMEVERPTQQG
ncbi:hypothetical protein FRC11_010726, partial [Ceratobasidium sp. 423]